MNKSEENHTTDKRGEVVHECGTLRAERERVDVNTAVVVTDMQAYEATNTVPDAQMRGASLGMTAHVL